MIRHGALGDLVLCLDAFAAIRRHHPQAEIILMTTPAFAAFGRMMPYFNAVWIDDRPSLWRLAAWYRLRRRLIAHRFTRVYDLQTSDRTAVLFHLLPWYRTPEWSGVARGCNYPRPERGGRPIHVAEWFAEQLKAAGVEPLSGTDLGWLDADLGGFALPDRFVLFVPGSSPHRPEKRWPAEHYIDLGNRLAGRGLTPVLLGTTTEAATTARIARECPGACDLTGRTGLPELAALARRAAGAVGGDTGPMHLIARVGCPAMVLFSSASDPVMSRPLGSDVTVLRKPSAAAITVDEVEAALYLR